VVVDPGKLPATPACGNGALTKDEACDDGNTQDGDGCAANCRKVEPGYSCVPPGKPCHQIARCGDGLPFFPELCDDGNTQDGDGCSAKCKVEIGFKCSGTPSVCTATTCGDKVKEGAEGCDDGNTMPFDGCSSDCQNEPKCAGGPCTSSCGDGFVLGAEECDDGNNLNSDGCSADCKKEKGFACTIPELGDKMNVPIVYRDFRAGNPKEFEPGAGDPALTLGIAGPTLDDEGKPVYAPAGTVSYITGQSTFRMWYRDVAGTNHTTVSKLTLFENGAGGYVNRYGANGEQWELTTPPSENLCGDVGREDKDAAWNAIPCTFCLDDKDKTTPQCDPPAAPTICQTKPNMLRCINYGGQWHGIWLVGMLDGNPLFFPVDDDTFTPAADHFAATVPQPYGSGSGEISGAKHNFHFTSEAGYWFEYDASKTYKLDFTGDDDVWVFINRKLAVDLGGIHLPIDGSVTLNAASAAKFGLENGKVYGVRVFQAERHVTASTYKLTLTGFNVAQSDCSPICGDGILTLGEECDDGKNTGGYGQCGPGCKLGAYCGDGIVQEGEDCDDGVNSGNPCPSGCRIIVIL